MSAFKQATFIGLLAATVLAAPSQSINKRDVITGNAPSSLVCDISGADLAYHDDIVAYIADLNDNGVCSVSANSCARAACGNTSGIFICNDNDEDIQLNCSIAADYASIINNNVGDGGCEDDGYTQGQQFDNRGFNVVVAYANCNLSPSLGPLSQG